MPEAIYLTEREVSDAIRKKYSGQGCFVLTGVRNGTGFERKPRTADALAISTWPSRGLYAEGFEIKSSRSDLKAELKNPAKAEEIAKYCRFWWLATPQGLVADLSQIPDTWGLIEVNGKGCSTVKQPKQLDPVPMDTLFVCSVLRNFAEGFIPVAEAEELFKPRIDEAVKRAAGVSQSRVKELERAIRTFESESGIKLLDERNGYVKWDIGDIGHAVATVMAIQKNPVRDVDHCLKTLRGAADALESARNLILGQIVGPDA